ncbi:hypothetical protein JNB88_14455 [Rhizobium cauense]|uniref:hypothetical protein n=1 Tax=Rhizobium cauense TaxID=1166683 RepID=UPI001C6F4DD7|nr:hypothetical protein [Rhizobium cauense]MBW9114842.1 hypothetical protein [Rhizobium cauense]
MWAILIGAALLTAGIVLLFRPALDRRASDPHRTSQGGPTLEPRRQGLDFLGLTRNWLALVVIGAGALLLALGRYL